MSQTSPSSNREFRLRPIGVVKATESSWHLEIDEPARPGLRHLDQFSHVLVFWWADQCDTPPGRSVIQTDLPYAKGTRAGVFACRTPERPNPIALTACQVLRMDEKQGVIHLNYIDAHDRTPVIDLKPYIPISDRIREVRVAEWFSDWPEWYEDAGEFFMKNPHLFHE